MGAYQEGGTEKCTIVYYSTLHGMDNSRGIGGSMGSGSEDTVIGVAAHTTSRITGFLYKDGKCVEERGFVQSTPVTNLGPNVCATFPQKLDFVTRLESFDGVEVEDLALTQVRIPSRTARIVLSKCIPVQI